jgi:ribosome-interacting GTPase 1
MLFETEKSEKHFLHISIDKKVRDFVRVLMPCQDKNGEYFAVPGTKNTVVVMGEGNTIDEVIDKIKDRSKYVNAVSLVKSFSSMESVKEKIKNGEKVGIPFN